MPTLAPSPLHIPEEGWAYVTVSPDEILVTLGDEFFTSGLVEFPEKRGVRGPVLHRVTDGMMGEGGRISVPFLARLVTAGGEGGGEAVVE